MKRTTLLSPDDTAGSERRPLGGIARERETRTHNPPPEQPQHGDVRFKNQSSAASQCEQQLPPAGFPAAAAAAVGARPAVSHPAAGGGSFTPSVRVAHLGLMRYGGGFGAVVIRFLLLAGRFPRDYLREFDQGQILPTTLRYANVISGPVPVRTGTIRRSPEGRTPRSVTSRRVRPPAPESAPSISHVVYRGFDHEGFSRWDPPGQVSTPALPALANPTDAAGPLTAFGSARTACCCFPFIETAVRAHRAAPNASWGWLA